MSQQKTPENSEQKSASEKYRNYLELEEMKLKIRYMKNDIEFKKNQMNTKAKEIAKMNEISKHKKERATSSILPYSSSYSLASAKSHSFYSSTSSTVRNSAVKSGSFSFFSDTKFTKSLSLPVSSPVYLSPNKRKVIFSSSTKPHHALNVATSNDASAPVMSSESLFPLIFDSASLLQSTVKLPAAATSSSSSPPSSSKTAADSGCISVTKTKPVTTSIFGSQNKYKLVKSKGGISTLNSNVMLCSGTAPSVAVQTKMRVDNNSEPSASSVKHFNQSDSQHRRSNSAAKTAVALRASSGNPQRRFSYKSLSKSSTPLTIHTAAKVVSKYKLKRLSPTSASLAAPRFPVSGFISKVPPASQSRCLGLDNKKMLSKYKLVKAHSHNAPSSYNFSSHNKSKRFSNFHHTLKSSDSVSWNPIGHFYEQPVSSPFSVRSHERNHIKNTKGKRQKSSSFPQHKKKCFFKFPSIQNHHGSSKLLPVSSTSRYVWKNILKTDVGGSNEQSLPICSKGENTPNLNSHTAKDDVTEIDHPKEVSGSASSQHRQQHQISTLQIAPFRGSQLSQLHQQVKKAQLKQRLKVLMAHRKLQSSAVRQRELEAAQTLSSLSGPPSSVKKVTSYNKDKDEGRLVLIRNTLYRSSSRKLSWHSGKAFAGGERKFAWPSKSLISRLRNEKTSKSIKGLRPQRTKLVTVRGAHFHTSSNGSKLTRVKESNDISKDGAAGVSRMNISGVTYLKTGLDTLELAPFAHKSLAASRAVHKSLSIVAAKRRKASYKSKLSKSKARHCIFYGRFGRCQRGKDCPFIHDPEKVAVCTRFLRGQCDNTANCPFSHDASDHKMPVCLFYLRGLCARPDCLYLHAKVSPDALPCKNFLQGFCPLGRQCKDLHSFVCPIYAVLGTCYKGESCPLLHRQSRKRLIDKLVKPATAAKEKEIPARTAPAAASTEKNGKDAEEPNQALEVSSSSSVTSISNPSHVVIPTKESALGAQPAYISLLSSPTQSQPVAKPSDHTPQTDTPVGKDAALPIPASEAYQRPQITPQFSDVVLEDKKSPLKSSLWMKKVVDGVSPEKRKPVKLTVSVLGGKSSPAVSTNFLAFSTLSASRPASQPVSDCNATTPQTPSAIVDVKRPVRVFDTGNPEGHAENTTTPGSPVTHPLQISLSATSTTSTRSSSSSGRSSSNSEHSHISLFSSFRVGSRNHRLVPGTTTTTSNSNLSSLNCIKFSASSDTEDSVPTSPPITTNCPSSLPPSFSGSSTRSGGTVSTLGLFKSTMLKGIIPSFLTGKVKDDNEKVSSPVGQ